MQIICKNTNIKVIHFLARNLIFARKHKYIEQNIQSFEINMHTVFNFNCTKFLTLSAHSFYWLKADVQKQKDNFEEQALRFRLSFSYNVRKTSSTYAIVW